MEIVTDGVFALGRGLAFISHNSRCLFGRRMVRFAWNGVTGNDGERFLIDLCARRWILSVGKASTQLRGIDLKDRDVLESAERQIPVSIFTSK